MSFSYKNSNVESMAIRTRRLVIPISITGHATPASKTVSAYLKECYVSTEGLTAAAAAADSGCNFTAPNDINGIIGVLVTGLGTVEKLLHASLEVAGTPMVRVACSPKGASTTGVTASGNVAVSLDTAVDFSVAAATGAFLHLDVLISEA